MTAPHARLLLPSILLLFFASLGTTGCAHRYRDQSRELVLDRATFDLECSADEVEVEVLEDNRMFGTMGGRMFSYGASGCGERLSMEVLCVLGKCSKS